MYTLSYQRAPAAARVHRLPQAGRVEVAADLGRVRGVAHAALGAAARRRGGAGCRPGRRAGRVLRRPDVLAQDEVVGAEGLVVSRGRVHRLRIALPRPLRAQLLILAGF